MKYTAVQLQHQFKEFMKNNPRHIRHMNQRLEQEEEEEEGWSEQHSEKGEKTVEDEEFPTARKLRTSVVAFTLEPETTVIPPDKDAYIEVLLGKIKNRERCIST
jgi:hypothetical protein